MPLVHFIHETWQCLHVWCIFMELIKKCGLWWFHWGWDLIAHNTKVDYVGHHNTKIPRLHWVHWWATHQNLQTLEWCGLQGLVQWVQEHLLDEHRGCWSSRLVHLPNLWVLSSCHDVTILLQFELHKIGLNVDHDIINAYNNIHVRYIMQMAWGIGELKRKWKLLMKRFDSTKPTYIVLFKTTTILRNFLHKCQVDFTFEVIGEQMFDLVD